MEALKKVLSSEPAVIIGFLISVIVLVIDYTSGSVTLRDAIENLSPLLTGLFIRQRVYAPDTVETLRASLGAASDDV